MTTKNGTGKIRVVGYCRVSTESQVRYKSKDTGKMEEKESLPGQRKLIEDHAALKGWELVRIYEDAGLTGKKDDRPGLQALFARAKVREFDAVIVRDLSRFGRSTLDLLKNAKTLVEDYGVLFVSLKENLELDMNNPYSKFLFQILSSVAELEHSMIHDRMNDGKMSKWRDKRIFNGSLPLGYLWNKDSHSIEIIPEEATIYQRIVTEYLDFKKSIRDIALGLKRDAVPTRLRGNWSVTAICQFLRNPAYYGVITANTKKLDEKGKVIGDKPASEHIIFNAPPLITKSRWDELQERLESARKRSGRPIVGAQQFLLYGLLQCGECGGKVVPRWGASRADGSAPRYYACHWRGCGKNQRELTGREKCTLPMIPADKLEGHIFWGHLMMRLGLNKEKYYLPAIDLGKWDRKIQTAQHVLEQLQEALRRKGIALKNIDRLLEDPDFDEDEFKGKRNGILSEIHVLNQQIGEAVSKIDSLHKLRDQEDLLSKFAQDKKGALREVHKRIMALPDEDKQRLLRGMLAGPIIIKRPYPDAELGDDPLQQWLDFSLRFNPSILKEILADGAGDKNRESAYHRHGGHAAPGCGPGPDGGALAGCSLLAAAAPAELL